MPTSILAPPPEARDGARGGEQRAGDGGRAERTEPEAARSSQCSPRFQASAPGCPWPLCPPAMAVGTSSPRPLPLLLLPLLLLLRAGPVRAESKVRAAPGPGRCSVGNRREGALWPGVRAKGGGGGPERRTRKGDRTSGLAWKPPGPGSQERSAWGKKRWRWEWCLGPGLRKGRCDPVRCRMEVSTETRDEGEGGIRRLEGAQTGDAVPSRGKGFPGALGRGSLEI